MMTTRVDIETEPTLVSFHLKMAITMINSKIIDSKSIKEKNNVSANTCAKGPEHRSVLDKTRETMNQVGGK